MQIEDLIEQIERFEKLIGKPKGTVGVGSFHICEVSDLIALKDEFKRRGEALEHYADRNSWKSGRGGTLRIYNVKSVADNGYDKAVAALTPAKAKGEKS